MNLEPLLAFIRQPESRGDYDIVWGKIAPPDRPPRKLTSMTIREVLAWQDRIDPKYPSEAAGAYQFMEDTLRDIAPKAGCSLDDPFNEATQDRLATYLLRRRGLDEYLNGEISVEGFCNRLAMEWASLPVVTARQGHKRRVKPGESYYADDGLNRSHVSVSAFLEAVRAVKREAPTPARKEPAMTGTKHPLKSKGIIGSLIAAVGVGGGVAPILGVLVSTVMGVEVGTGDAQAVLEAVEQIVVAGGVILAFIGRLTATEVVTTRR